MSVPVEAGAKSWRRQQPPPARRTSRARASGQGSWRCRNTEVSFDEPSEFVHVQLAERTTIPRSAMLATTGRVYGATGSPACVSRRWCANRRSGVALCGSFYRAAAQTSPAGAAGISRATGLGEPSFRGQRDVIGSERRVQPRRRGRGGGRRALCNGWTFVQAAKQSLNGNGGRCSVHYSGSPASTGSIEPSAAADAYSSILGHAHLARSRAIVTQTKHHVEAMRRSARRPWVTTARISSISLRDAAQKFSSERQQRRRASRQCVRMRDPLDPETVRLHGSEE